ncbi:hypothetical protein M409DRAFT_26038 [Zasmidium cellare ATCC 36951]|uniref:Uncharacterized protein n=1 Tax=Zasmidium cellare ATCC 36951 TaxID=1080233 RepID=A0A6A6C8F0_ZASCE|nr:uncharacterized protein M409DRAFT_26038 [Zasmidium cellare ATCC 36951]KAF2163424.1 hypothetical protein M409DRAFT_26038 [Zasmidium cellare ATCC 36951]
MDDSEQSAAAKVFGLPELLEHILEEIIDEQRNSKVAEGLQPLMCLAAVQRVNTTFHDTIMSSKKLQRLMVTPLEDKTTETSDQVCLLNGMLQLHLHGCEPQFDGDFALYVHEINPETCDMLKSDKFKEGSWRNARIQADPLATVDVGIIPDDAFGTGNWDLVHLTWSLKGDATLGELVDVYLEMIEFEQEHELVWRDREFHWVEK